jgi:lactoylglutathione lyase
MDFCWVTVNVRSMEDSLEFYQNIVGLKLKRKMNPMPGTEIAFLGNGGTEVELIRNEKNNDCDYGKDISLGFVVESLGKTMEEFKGKGIIIHSGPFQPNPMLKFIYVLDPNGLRIQFIENIRH